MKKGLIAIPTLICVIMFVLLYIAAENVGERASYYEFTDASNIESIDYGHEVEITKELAHKIGRAAFGVIPWR